MPRENRPDLDNKDDRPRRRMRESAIPVWVWAVIAGGGLMVLVCGGGVALFVMGAKKAARDMEAVHQEREQQADNKLPEKPKKTSGELTRDFEALCDWCERSIREVRAEGAKNTIRGGEKAKEKHKEFDSFLANKEVRWQLTVGGIDNQLLRVKAFRHVTEEDVVDGKRLQYRYMPLTVDVNEGKQRHFVGEDHTYDPKYEIKTIPPEKLLALSVGDKVTVVGDVEWAKFGVNGCSVKLKRVRVE